MSALRQYLKIKNKSITTFGEELGCSRLRAMRIVNGERFNAIHALFLKIYDLTRLTPNDILGIPPRNEGGK